MQDIYIIKQVWQSGLIPSDWKKGIILPIYKGKGSPKDCRNYRGITLPSVPGKVLATVLLNKVCYQLLAHRRMEHSGFTPGRSTIDRIDTLNSHPKQEGVSEASLDCFRRSQGCFRLS